MRLFVHLVQAGQQPPEWLMQFMADGAREFLKGGKAWQKKDGRKNARHGWQEAIAHVLHQEGGLSVNEVVQALGVGDADGADRSRTMRRQIERGAPVAGGGALRSIIIELLDHDFIDLPEKRRRECRARLSAALSRLDAYEIEPGYD